MSEDKGNAKTEDPKKKERDLLNTDYYLSDLVLISTWHLPFLHHTSSYNVHKNIDLGHPGSLAE